MIRPRKTSRLPEIIAALGHRQQDAEVRRIIELFDARATLDERYIGEPATHAVRLRFPKASGEIVLYDGVVVAVVLHVAPMPGAPYGVRLEDWLPGADNNATLDDLKAEFDAKPSFVGFGRPYFALGGAFATMRFRDNRGWKEPGNLLSIDFGTTHPGRGCDPLDDDCPVCSGLLVRDQTGALDVAATVAALQSTVDDGRLTEDAHWIKLADLQPLHTSGLMPRVESQLTCVTCRRIGCFALSRDGAPTFGYYTLDQARRHRLAPVPAVESWGTPERIAAAQEAMQYVDHEPGSWFLVARRDDLYLDVRYVISSIADDSALIRLDGPEVAAYRDRGRRYLSSLAEQVSNHGPHREDSPFRSRNLYRGPDARRYRDEVGAAIMNHTWLAQQRR